MRNKDKNDEPIYEVKGAGIFDKINGFEFNDEYEIEKRKKESENTYKKFNGLSESQKIDVSNSFLKIYLRLIKVFISVVVGFTVIKAFMEHYMVVNDKLKERLEETNIQNTAQTSTQNITDEEYNLDYSNEIYAKADTITFGEYGTIPTGTRSWLCLYWSPVCHAHWKSSVQGRFSVLSLHPQMLCSDRLEAFRNQAQRHRADEPLSQLLQDRGLPTRRQSSHRHSLRSKEG